MLLGFAVALQRRRARFALFVAIAVGMAIALEVGQALLGTGRPSDVTAILARFVGASFGYVLWQLPRKLGQMSEAARS